MSPRAFHQSSTSNLSTPEGTYIYTLTPLSATHLAASTSTSSTSSSLITFSKSTLTPTTTIPHAHTIITSLSAYPASPQTLLSSGTDGFVKLWDLRCPPSAALASKINVGAPVLCASANAQGGIIAGTEMQDRISRVCVWDGRAMGEKPTWVSEESHGDDVSFVGFAGGEGGGRWGVSGGMDGLVNVFDLLAGKRAGGEDDEEALWQVVNVGASVHRAGFLNAGGGGAAGKGEWVFGVSTDESLVLRSFNHTPGGEEEDAEGEVAGDVGDVRGKLDCEYVVDVLRANSTGVGGIVVAGNKEIGKQQVDLVPLRWTGSGQWGFTSEDRVRLQGGHGEEVCRGVWIDEGSETVFTSGEDGLVKVWREETSRGEGVSKGRKKRVRGGGEREREKERFKPY